MGGEGNYRNTGIQEYRNTEMEKYRELKEENTEDREKRGVAVCRFSITGGLSNTGEKGYIAVSLEWK